MVSAAFVLLESYPEVVLALLVALTFLGVLMVFQNYSGRVTTHRTGSNKQMLKAMRKQFDELQDELSGIRVNLDAVRAFEEQLQNEREARAAICDRLDSIGERAGLWNSNPGDSDESQDSTSDELNALRKKMEFVERRMLGVFEAHRRVSDDRWEAIRSLAESDATRPGGGSKLG